MNCDLILTEESCRFCLGDAIGGNSIVDSEHYLCVDGRITRTSQILRAVDLKVDTSLRDLPSQMCKVCKKVITDFYKLKRNFKENETVLMGKAGIPVEHQQKEGILPVIEEFLTEHLQESFRVEKFTDKLLISKQTDET